MQYFKNSEIKMKRFQYIVLATFLAMVALTNTSKAQIFADFEPPVVITNQIYTEICGPSTVIPASSFYRILAGNTIVADRNDGYFPLELSTIPGGFKFDFGGFRVNRIWISVNGFVSFDNVQPGSISANQRNPNGLFIKSATFPSYVAAPFWGDHYYRQFPDRISPTNRFTASSISYAIVNETDFNCQPVQDPRRMLIIQWKDLNVQDTNNTQSVANFQIRLIERDRSDIDNYQGEIEFWYGQVNGNDSSTVVNGNYVGASVGLKGSLGFNNDYADFYNGLKFNTPATSGTDTVKTFAWKPTGGDARIMRFVPRVRQFSSNNWGNGDPDLSTAAGQRHFGLDQNRFVTLSDVHTILKSETTRIRLDSVYRRNAFYADVNHNGRYYFTKSGNVVTKNFMPYRNINFDRYDVGEGPLPAGITNPFTEIYYEATSYDAALILGYLQNIVPTLPWLLDTTVQSGKAGSVSNASSVEFVNAENINSNTYKVPVYLNGNSRIFSTTFDVENANVLNVETINNSVVAAFDNNRVAIVGNGSFEFDKPVAYVTVQSTNAIAVAKNVNFNDTEVPSITIELASQLQNAFGVYNSPNPFSQSTNVSVSIENAGNYSVGVYDQLGNKLTTLRQGWMTPGVYNLEWNGTNQSGASLSNGMYFVRVDGDRNTASRSVILNK
jgi:hypothetical protein